MGWFNHQLENQKGGCLPWILLPEKVGGLLKVDEKNKGPKKASKFIGLKATRTIFVWNVDAVCTIQLALSMLTSQNWRHFEDQTPAIQVQTLRSNDP